MNSKEEVGGVNNWLGEGVVTGLGGDVSVFSLTSQACSREVGAHFFNTMLFQKIISVKNVLKFKFLDQSVPI